MRKIVLLITICLLSIIVYSQTIKVSTYYDEDSSRVKEVYNVLENDTSLIDGVFEKYSQEAWILTKGFYSKGVQEGEWFELFENGNVDFTGIFNDNLFTGYNFYYNDKGDYEHTDYYKLDTLVDASDSLISSGIINKINLLKSMGFYDDSLMINKVNLIKAERMLYDTILNLENKISIGDKLLNNLSYISIWFPFYKDAKEKLLTLQNEIRNYEFKIKDSLLEEQRNIYLFTTEKLLESDSLQEVSIKQININTKFSGLKQTANTLFNIQNNLDARLEKMKNEGINVPDGIMTSFSKYNSANTIDSKIDIGHKLIDELNNYENQYSKVVGVKSKIDDLDMKFEKSYKNSYPELFQVAQNNIQNNIKRFNDETELTKRVEIGNNLISDIESNISGFAMIDSIDMLIDEESLSLSDNYLLSYPSIYSKEIKTLNKSIEDYRLISNIKDKISEGNTLLDTIYYYNNAYSRFIAIDKYINENYEQIEPVYKQKYRPIYKAEFPQINNSIKKYKLVTNTELKLESGNDILEKIKSLEQNASLFATQEQSIDSLFLTVKNMYKQDFPAIYKMELHNYQSKINNYKKLSASDARLVRGDEILKDIGFFIEKFNSLVEQKSKIDSKLSKIEAEYQIQFPAVYKIEIRESRDNIKSYDSMGNIASKFKLGNIIIERIDIIDEVYPVIKEDDKRISNELPLLKQGYKDNFPLLYKKYFSELSTRLKEYKASGYVKSKSTLSKSLVKSIDELNEQYAKLKVQNDFINSAYSDFIMYYQNRKPVKNIFIKGKNTFKEMKKAYDTELNFEEKLKKGKDIREMLQKLISISNDDNTKLNKKIRSVKSVQEFLKAIGL